MADPPSPGPHTSPAFPAGLGRRDPKPISRDASTTSQSVAAPSISRPHQPSLFASLAAAGRISRQPPLNPQ